MSTHTRTLVVVSLLFARLAVFPSEVAGDEHTGVTGSGQPLSIVQPSLAMPYLIRTSGAPDRLGEIVPFASFFAPAGWHFAEGQLLNISEYPDLFAVLVLGTAYGGGAAEFLLPDLRGRAAISSGPGVGPVIYMLGDVLGNEAVTQSLDRLAPHTHTLPPSNDPTGTTGVGQPIDVVQPSLTLNYIIAISGAFPGTVDPVPGDVAFLGQIALFAGSVAPAGWAFADGQLMVLSQNTALFALLGTRYGGDGKSNFTLPDLRGRVIMGIGQGPGLSHRDQGEVAGDVAVAQTIDQLPAHDHTFLPELLAIAEAQDLVEDLVGQGVLNGGQGNSLMSKLEAVVASLANGKTNAACGQLNAFVNQVISLVDEGVLSAAEGQALVDFATAAMINLGC